MTLSTNEIQTVSKGIVHGPAMISSDAISLNIRLMLSRSTGNLQVWDPLAIMQMSMHIC
jgi:hypothetical protein